MSKRVGVIGLGIMGRRGCPAPGPMMVAGRYRKATMKNSMWQKDMRIIADFAARLRR